MIYKITYLGSVEIISHINESQEATWPPYVIDNLALTILVGQIANISSDDSVWKIYVYAGVIIEILLDNNESIIISSKGRTGVSYCVVKTNNMTPSSLGWLKYIEHVRGILRPTDHLIVSLLWYILYPIITTQSSNEHCIVSVTDRLSASEVMIGSANIGMYEREIGINPTL